MQRPSAPLRLARTVRYVGGLCLRKTRSAALRGVAALHPILGPRTPLSGHVYAKSYTRAAGLNYRMLDAPRRIPYGCPEQIHEAPETFVTVLPRGRVFGQDGAVITPDNRLLSDVSIPMALPDWRHPALKKVRFPPVARVSGDAAVIASVLPGNYWHWMVDILPRVGLLERAGFAPARLIVNADLPFQKETLARLGYGPERLMPLDATTHLEVERLIVPSMPVAFCMISPETISYLRNKFLPEDGVGRPADLLYLSRKDAARRYISNEDELFASLKPFGFRSVTLSSLSVMEQASLFSRARLVVAPHGAGCTNMVFADPRAGFVEFMPDHGYHPSFKMLTGMLGCAYTAVPYSGPVPAPANPVADVSAVRHAVEKMLTLV